MADCSFVANSALMEGGAASLQGLQLSLQRLSFVNNSAGNTVSLYADAAAGGGGLWISDHTGGSNITASLFSGTRPSLFLALSFLSLLLFTGSHI